MNSLPTDYQTFIHKSRYARWLEEEQRRETWQETVARYFDFMQEHLKKNNDTDIADMRPQLEQAVLNLDIMPSMRALMSAGLALEQDNVAGFNCSYLAVDTPRAFDETLYILMCGTGVGFSVERQYINKLPDLPEELHPTDTIIKVADSNPTFERTDIFRIFSTNVYYFPSPIANDIIFTNIFRSF